MPGLLEKPVMQQDGIHKGSTAPHSDMHRIIKGGFPRPARFLCRERGVFAGRKAGGRIAIIGRHSCTSRRERPGDEACRVRRESQQHTDTDGRPFIVRIPSKSFNESIRMKDCIRMRQNECEGKTCGCQYHIRRQRRQGILHEVRDIRFLRAQEMAAKNGRKGFQKRALKREGRQA